MMENDQVRRKVKEFLDIPCGENYHCGGWERVVRYATHDVPSLYQVFFDLKDFGAISYWLKKAIRGEGEDGGYDACVPVPFGSETLSVIFEDEKIDFTKIGSSCELIELILSLELKARGVRSELGYKHITLEELEELKRLVPSVCPGCGEKTIELQANAVFSGERLKIDDDLNLSLEQEADQPLVDEVWGWTCANCFRDGEFGVTYRVEL